MERHPVPDFKDIETHLRMLPPAVRAHLHEVYDDAAAFMEMIIGAEAESDRPPAPETWREQRALYERLRASLAESLGKGGSTRLT